MDTVEKEGEHEMSAIDAKVLEELAKIDTPTVCNVIELFEVRPQSSGYMDARIRACFPEMPPVVGFAATATFRSADPPSKGDVYSSTCEQIERFAELDGQSFVVFQDLDDPAAGATFGDQMCATYKAFGAVGLITSGAGRDLDQVRALEFPVFTAGTICAHGYCHTLQIHVPVRVGGITIRPNDLVHGDANGVTTIPREVAPEVVDAAYELLAAEAVLVHALSGSTATFEVLSEAIREKEELISRLRARLSRSI
jgi:4-hydroxy-4-methyl-2-oxoglutarate aldolase